MLLAKWLTHSREQPASTDSDHQFLISPGRKTRCEHAVSHKSMIAGAIEAKASFALVLCHEPAICPVCLSKDFRCFFCLVESSAA
jgi:hypothetical protein